MELPKRIREKLERVKAIKRAIKGAKRNFCWPGHHSWSEPSTEVQAEVYGKWRPAAYCRRCGANGYISDDGKIEEQY